jgi:AP-1 complex subunit mu
VFKHYFEELEEESLRDNFVVVYELLDEMMDFGYPQYTEAKILSEFIKTDAYRMEVAVHPPMAVTNAVSWRMEGIKYKKNEASFTMCSVIIYRRHATCLQHGQSQGF